MLESMKNAALTIGTPVGDAAKSFAAGTTSLARRVGGATVDTARRIGPKRALLGLAIAGVVVGGTILLVRYLRDRDEEQDDAEGTEANTQAHSRHKLSRAERKAQRAMAH